MFSLLHEKEHICDLITWLRQIYLLINKHSYSFNYYDGINCFRINNEYTVIYQYSSTNIHTYIHEKRTYSYTLNTIRQTTSSLFWNRPLSLPCTYVHKSIHCLFAKIAPTPKKLHACARFQFNSKQEKKTRPAIKLAFASFQIAHNRRNSRNWMNFAFKRTRKKKRIETRMQNLVFVYCIIYNIMYILMDIRNWYFSGWKQVLKKCTAA